MPQRAQASHAMGADITYTCLGNNTYQVTVAFYRDCDGISAPSSITLDYFSPTCNPSGGSLTINQSNNCPGASTTNGSEVSPLCPSQVSQSTCNGGGLPGVQVYYYCGVVTLPSNCPDWVIGYGECCRNAAVTNLDNASSADQYVFATINNTNNICNNSPAFTNLPVPYFCIGQGINYNHGTVDVDGDSLVYTLINPLDDYGVPISYNNPFSPTNPMNTTGGFNFDSQTGQMGFIAQGQQVAVVTVKVDEYRNGVLVGSTMRDIQIVILSPGLCNANQNPPTQMIDTQSIVGGGIVDPTNPNLLQMCPNSTITFQVPASDADGNNVSMTTNVNVAIPGATFTVTGSGPSVVGTFTWTSTAADTGLNTFVVNVKDDGCPFNQTSSVSYSILVFDEVRATPSSSVYCNTPIQLSAVGGTSFTWTPASGLSNPNIPNPTASPSVPTTYVVTSDCGSDTIFVDVQPDFSLSVSNDTTICLNSVVQLNAQGAPSNYAPFTYQWTPSSSLSGSTASSPLAQPTQSTTYYVTATSNVGCKRRDSIRVNISGVAPRVTAFTAIDTVCPGGTTQLSYSVAPLNCRASTLACNTPNTVYQVGSSNQFSTSTTTYPAIYGNWDRSAGHQLLYRASELSAAGTNGGVISQIAFDIAQINGTNSYENFTISVGCTSIDNISSWQPGLQTVFTPKTVGITPGWNTYTFDTPYEWDGFSNVIVQICFTKSTWTNNSNTYYTPTNFSSVYYQRNNTIGGVNACSISTTSGISNQRPNTRFGICLQPFNNATITWEPSALFSNPNAPNPQVRVYGTTNFVANVDDGGCIGSGFVEVVVDTNIILEAGPDTSLCTAQPLQLYANATGNPAPILLSCGANGTSCVGPQNQKVVGLNDGIGQATSPFNGNTADRRMQMLYRATDLDAATMQTGVISAIGFNLTKSSNGAFPSLTIKMGCTNLNVLGGNFVPGLTEVFTAKNVSTVNGWNTLTLDNTFDWDGFSNIIIEICFDNFDFGAVGLDFVPYTNTPFTSVLYASSDIGTGCNLDNSNASFTSSSQRPDVRISYCTPPPGQYSYQWSPTVDLSDPTIANPIFTGTVSRSYGVTVTDGTCIATDSVTINYYNGYDSNVFGNNVGCNGAADGNLISAPIGGVGPYDFTWSDGSSTIQSTTGAQEDTVFNLSAGTYTITLTDNNGCAQTDTVILTVPPPLAATFSTTNVSCAGGSNGVIDANVTGGTTPYTFAWSNLGNTASITNLRAGTYTLTVTDASGCVFIDSATVTEPAGMMLSTNVSDVSCYRASDGSATVNVVGGVPPYDYRWTGGRTGQTINNLVASIYLVTVTDASGCTRRDTAIVTQPDSFSINVMVTATSCYNGSDGTASASVNGDVTNYTFVWQTTPPQTGPNITGLPRGPLTLEVTEDTSGNNCMIPTTVIIPAPPQTILTSAATDASCYQGSDGTGSVAAVSGGSPPFTYIWSTNDTGNYVDNLPAGDYYVTATDANGCPEYDTITVAEPDSISINSSVIDVSCFGEEDGTITANATGGTPPYNYSWPGQIGNPSGGGTLDDLPDGTYRVIVTDANGCVDSLTGIEVIEPPALAFAMASADSASCPDTENGVINALATGGTGSNYTYNIDGLSQSNGDFISLGVGSYTLIVTDGNNCAIDTTLTVLAPPPVLVEFDPDTFQLTLGDTVQLAPNVVGQGALVYSWEPSNTLNCNDCPSVIATPLLTTAYEVTVFDQNGCPYSDIATVEVENNLILFVPNAFSPNGDGYNDFLQVFGISIEKVNFKVFNRWGEKVYDGSNLQQGWDGTYHGEPMPPGVYVYYVEVTYTDGQKKAQKGSVTIIK